MSAREHAQAREKALVELQVAAGTSDQHLAGTALALAGVHATLAVGAALIEVALAIRSAGRPMGGRS